MTWSDRTISYPNTSGSCAISGDGSVIAYGVTGGSGYVNNGVTILSDVGKVTESSVYIQTATGGYAGYGLSLDFAGSQFVTTTVYGSGNGLGGGGYGYLYTRGPNLYESYGNVVSSGPMVAASFSGDVKSHFVSVTSSQIWSGVQNLSFFGFGIAWSNELGLFVSVGGISTSFAYSFDGITWTPSPSVFGTYFISVTWSKDLGLFVAVANGDISAKSSDGITWTSSSIGGSSNWQGVTWARELGLFLAVGSQVKSVYSTNGSSWTVDGNLDNTVNWLSVAWSPKLLLFVAVGNDKFSTSPDGTIWTPNAFGSGYTWLKIIWSPERELFVAVGDGDSFAYSSDGLSWTRGSFGVAFSTWNAITWAREVNTFVAFSTNGYASYSADGINWTTPLLVNSGFNASSIAWSPQNGRFASSGYSNFIYLNVGTVKTPALLANYVSANYLLGDGSSISNIQASSIVQPFANLVVSNSVTTTNIFANTLTVGNVVVATQTGDLAPAASGKINGVNITALNRRVRASNAAVQKAVSSWTEHATPNGYNWFSMCWSPELGLFCAVNGGNAAVVMTSSDGVNWTENEIPNSYVWIYICWSPELGIFCAVNYGSAAVVMTSSDGVNWTENEIPKDYKCISVCWSPELGLFCAVNYNTAVVMTSSDGVNWTEHTIPNAYRWLSVCWSPELGIFCAVNYNAAVVMTSSDGVNWTENEIPSSYNWNSVCWSPELGLFCAVNYGNSAVVMTSSNGVNWTEHTIPNNYYWESVCWSPELSVFCAANGGNAVVMTSRDGVNWTEHAIPNGYSWTSVCWSPELSLFCAVNSYYGSSVMTSAIALPAPSSTLLTPPGVISSSDNAIHVANTLTTSNLLVSNALTVGKVVVATQTGDVAPAASGKINGVNITALNRRVRASNAAVQKAVSTWTEHTIPNNYNWNSVCWSPELGLFCAVNFGSAAVIMTSRDGINWTEHAIPNAYSWFSVCWSPELGIFCAVNAGNNNVVMTSSDGVNWTEHTIPHNYNWSSVCWSPELGIFCAVNYYSAAAVVMTSSDGVNWTEHGIPNNYVWISICWSPELGIFCAVNGGSSAVVMTSSDGVNWTEHAIPHNYGWSSVCWSPELGLFCATTYIADVVMTSSDSVNWTEHTIPHNYGWSSVCWSPELSVFCAVNGGNAAVVMTSRDGVNWTEHAILNTQYWNSICWSPELSVFCAVNLSYYGTNVFMTSAIALPAPSSTLLTPPGVISSVDGKIGIGTDNPGSTLEVAGNVYASNAVTTTNVFATTYYGDGGLLSNINSGFVQPLANLVVSNTVTTSNLSVSGNIIPVTQGNTYIQGNVVVSGNVYSSLGQLGVGGSLLFSLGAPYTPSTYTGTIPNAGTTTNKIRLDAFTQQGASTYISTSANGCFQFTQSGVYTVASNFLTNFNNILGFGIGSNVIDYGTRTDQTYLYSVVPFISQNPTGVLEAQFYVSDLTKYYYIDAFSVDGAILQPTSSVNGGTWISIAPLGGVAQTITLGTLGNTVTGRATNYGAQLTDYYIGCSTGITVTLPLGATLTAGKQYVIKDESGTATTSRITVAATSPDLIDGSSTAILSINYIALTVYWTGAKWSIV